MWRPFTTFRIGIRGGLWNVVYQGDTVNHGLGQFSDLRLDHIGILYWMPTDADEDDVPQNLPGIVKHRSYRMWLDDLRREWER